MSPTSYPIDTSVQPHRQPAAVEVEVAPPKPEHLAPAHPGVGGQVERRVQPVRPDGLEEHAQLRGIPRLDAAVLPTLDRRRVGQATTLRGTMPLRAASAIALLSITWMFRTVFGAKPAPRSPHSCLRPSVSSRA